MTEADRAIQIRLAGSGLPSAGRLEMFYNGTWGTVCYGYSRFSHYTTNTVCRQLGYSSAVRFGFLYGSTNGSSWLNFRDIQCSGRESSIIYCKGLNWRLHHCVQQQNLGITCKDGMCW